MTETIQVRMATPADAEAIHGMIQALATFEQAPEAVETTAATLLRDGFGKDRWFECLVAEHPAEGIVGIALFYFGYSTWKGRMLYLDDLVIDDAWRRKGIGTLLMEHLVRRAQAEGVRQMRWQVLDWNEAAIRMYEKLGATLDPAWVNCLLAHSQIENWTFLPKEA
ncbi:MAG: GNAT family N-acetyltransferase [Bacteroidia bacterium]